MKHRVRARIGLLFGALALTGVSAAPAGADEATGYRTDRARPVYRHWAARRPVRIVREVIVERPVYVRRRVVVRDYVRPYGYGPPPFAYGPGFYGPPRFRPRFAYGPGFYGPPPFRPRFAYGPGFYAPFRPVGFGFGFGPRFGWGGWY